jgi:hypothetical protein
MLVLITLLGELRSENQQPKIYLYTIYQEKMTKQLLPNNMSLQGQK